MQTHPVYEKERGSFVGYLPIILFLLGVVFLFLGWRWQSPPNEEAMTALKGLGYLKREIIRVQDQVLILEEKLQAVQQTELKESALKVERSEVEQKDVDHTKIECEDKSKIYQLKPKEKKASISGGEVESQRNISPKYQEVLDLAAKGHLVPEIAQTLSLSQDGVMMVLQMQPKGATR